jgi:hypoxanthine phosphoribosyltransferase
LKHGSSSDGEPSEPLELLISERRIRARVASLAKAIQRDYGGSGGGGVNLTLVVVLKGAAVFAADLMRQLTTTTPFAVEYIFARSYGAATQSSGQVQLRDIDMLAVSGRNVLIIEDILDTGLTAATLLEAMRPQRPASLALLPFLRKPAAAARQPVLPVPHVGFDIADNDFVVGYGMDFAERYRNLPAIYRLHPIGQK